MLVISLLSLFSQISSKFIFPQNFPRLLIKINLILNLRGHFLTTSKSKVLQKKP